jgi:NAD-dependent SIR2 family protein deacetylase
MNPETVTKAAQAIRDADALLIGAGAGMGVDSGLPDFRGAEGFWKAYPPLAHLNLDFTDIAQQRWFTRDPELAWGFYGHRLNLYRTTIPHTGFDLLHQWARAKTHGYFVFTSNVDGQFQKAGFSPARIVECHGSIHHLQCGQPCCTDVWSADDVTITVDETTLRATRPLPACPTCGKVARPHVLMFDDWAWHHQHAAAQERRFMKWVNGLPSSVRLTVVECGAGKAIATIRWLSDRLAATGATLIRINPRDSRVPRGAISLPMGARDALRAIAAAMEEV